ncbi:unnamed protein product [Cylicocyclus nassatus]|uniref:Aminopeptidase n=1 Tax=Cylicocyclus nassatus TaxID=53992 RepID=A0AA36MDM0_CYLNA|nr:unnamed protein product [Cylicocyclus nassatus]
MSSYLLAVFVSEFTYNEARTTRGVRVRLWSAPGSESQRDYGLKVATTALRTFEKYFGLNEVMLKQDLVALENFGSGAMENWGLITFRKKLLLDLAVPNASPNIVDLLDNKYIRHMAIESVVTHELTHQWFGNLVTLAWWEELWLNEGFAEYFENLRLVSPADDELAIDYVMFLSGTEEAMQVDASVRSRPISSIIHEYHEIRKSFDTISYKKGAAIIAMLRAVLGNKNFRRGLTHYLKKFAYKCTKSENLFQAISEVIDEVEGPNGLTLDVLHFGTQWTKMMGFPLVTARTLGTRIEIRQQRYLLNTSVQEHEKYRFHRQEYKWDVPIWLTSREGDTTLKWLKTNEPLYVKLESLRLPVIMNPHRNGYYRQNYDSAAWMHIARLLKQNHTVLDHYTRYVLLCDAFSAAFIGQLDYGIVFELIRYAHASDGGEQHRLPWKAIIDGFDKLLTMYRLEEEDASSVKSYMQAVLFPFYREIVLQLLGQETEFGQSIAKRNSRLPPRERIVGMMSERKRWKSVIDIKAAVSLLSLYCKIETGCSSMFRMLFESGVLRGCSGFEKASQCVHIYDSFKGIAYCQGVKELGVAAFRKVDDLLKLEDDADEKEKLATGLGCVQNITLLKRKLLEALDMESNYSREEIVELFGSVAKNPLSDEWMLCFCISNWKAIYERVTDSITWIVKSCFSKVRSHGEVLLIKALQKSGCNGCDHNAIHIGLEQVEHRIHWIERYSKKVSELAQSELESLR